MARWVLLLCLSVPSHSSCCKAAAVNGPVPVARASRPLVCVERCSSINQLGCVSNTLKESFINLAEHISSANVAASQSWTQPWQCIGDTNFRLAASLCRQASHQFCWHLRVLLAQQLGSMRRHDNGWLPSSTQFFATIVVATVLTVAFSLATTPATASQVAPDQPMVMVAVGRLLDCQLPAGLSADSVSLNVLTATAKAARTGGDTKLSALVHGGTALVSSGCSLHLTSSLLTNSDSQQSSWQAGPLDQHQELQLSGFDALDCLVHGEQVAQGADQAPYVFLLRAAGRHKHQPAGARRLAACQRLVPPMAPQTF
jgi:hypothetical protein